MVDAPMLQIKRFFQKQRQKPDGSLMMEDWVEIGPVGLVDRTCTPYRVRDLIGRLRPFSSNDPASVQAHMKADIVRKAYDVFKSGNELPEEGTPLAAWNALTPEQAEVLRARGFKTVEAVSVMTDAHIQNIPLPMRDLIMQAKAFMDARETNRVAVDLTAKERQIANLTEETAEQRQQIRDLIEKVNVLASMVAEEKSEKTDTKRKKAAA